MVSSILWYRLCAPSRPKRWSDSSGPIAVETHDSGEYRSVRGKLQCNRERITVPGLFYDKTGKPSRRRAVVG